MIDLGVTSFLGRTGSTWDDLTTYGKSWKNLGLPGPWLKCTLGSLERPRTTWHLGRQDDLGLGNPGPETRGGNLTIWDNTIQPGTSWADLEPPST